MPELVTAPRSLKIMILRTNRHDLARRIWTPGQLPRRLLNETRQQSSDNRRGDSQIPLHT